MTEARRRIDVAEAAALIRARLTGWGTVRVPLDAAQGEILRQAITAERDQPPFDRVTMDGIAIRCRDFGSETRRFAVTGTQAAGRPALSLPAGATCVAIMTGAALPEGADTVVPVERVTRDGPAATIADSYQPVPGQFIHRRASDHRRGETLLASGTLLGAPEMAILTVGGTDTVEVARRPAITVVSTGDELVDVGQPLGPTQIRSSNDRAIAAALATRGFIDCDRLHLPDDRALLETALGELLAEQDVLILTGGVSMGEFDYVPQVLLALGMELVFHKVLQRPGMPLWFGVSPAGKPVFALPGNPVSSLVCLVRYVAPALVAALGAVPRPDVIVRLDRHVQFEPDLTYFLPVTLRYGADGECLATPKPTNTSGDFVALGGTDGFVELPRGMSEFAPGYTARFYGW
ncbi:MAG: molybdopterin molybdotransferase MoeA [Gammaproteobacteria bacterium]|nr:molybdopterin molybdotransferase MoeA [Gammaproteobacteria bacterium]